MPRIQTFPYLRAGHGRIAGGDWLQFQNGETRPAADILPHWDPVVNISVVRTLSLDQVGIRYDCGLADDDPLRLTVIWSSPGTGLRGHGSRIDPGHGTSPEVVELRLDVDGALLGDRLRIETHLVLAGQGKSESVLAPRRPGSILWQDEKTIVLEGQGSRFPTEPIDFGASASWLPAEAAWYLDWDPHDLHQPVLRGMRLFINTGHAAVTRAVAGTEPADRAIQEAIRYDVARTLITGALASDDFVREADQFADGSLGAAIVRLTRGLFPRIPITGLQSIQRQQPFQFECDLQAALRLFDGL